MEFNPGILGGGIAAAAALHQAGVKIEVAKMAKEIRVVGAGIRL